MSLISTTSTNGAVTPDLYIYQWYVIFLGFLVGFFRNIYEKNLVLFMIYFIYLAPTLRWREIGLYLATGPRLLMGHWLEKKSYLFDNYKSYIVRGNV